MKKILFSITLFSVLTVHAQDYLGFLNSNYAGITGAQLNPANIVDGRLRFDINLVGLSFNAANNYLGIKREAFAHEGSIFSAISRSAKGEDGFPAFKDPEFQKKYMVDISNGSDKSVYSSLRVSLPSFMISLGTKNAVGLSMNMRFYATVDGISEDLAKLLYTDIGRDSLFSSDYYASVKKLLGTEINNEHLSANAMVWLEYGLTFAHVFRDKDEHFFKAGLTPKLLQGLGAAYGNVENLRLKFTNNPISPNNDSLQVLDVFQTNVNYGHSKNLEIPDASAQNQQNNPFSGNDRTLYGTFSGFPKFESYPGFGLDVGAVYEWRPNYRAYKYDMDEKKDIWRRDKNKYKLKVGLSVLDIGSIKFDKGSNSRNFRIDTTNIKYRLLGTTSYPVFSYDSIIKAYSHENPDEGTFRMSLPTALSIQVDYNIWKDFYVNLTPYFAFQQTNREAKVHEITIISLTPRWDHKWFGLAVPINYNSFFAKAGQPIKMGAMLRLGPIVLGTNDLLNYFTGTFFGTNFYTLLKVPIPYGAPKDKDKDGISDRKDNCKTIPGIWEFHGCPDKDGDHIQDGEDLCPDVAGLKEMHDCPDQDKDGITDKEDACPDSAGTAEFKGCPDRDNDKIIDREDACPDAAGIPEFKGCPDKDADGTMDKEDLCPDVFGPKEFKGCPDKDGDTVFDKDDECPEISGPVENKGCPWPDTDKDGINDKMDSCVTVPGIVQYKGCPPPPPPPPPLKPSERKIIEKAFASLEFATAKDIIKPKSFPSLNELAKLLLLHKTDWTLRLSGHTDNEGTPEKNMVLSEKRAKAVKNYLMKKGVSDGQIMADWFGQTVPIADNATPKGRQKNRRVEMKISFKE